MVKGLKKFNLKSVGRGMKKGWDKNGQLICALVAAGCTVAAVVEAVKVGPVAVKIKEERQNELDILTADLQDGEISQEEYKKQVKETNVEAAKEYAYAFAPTAGFLMVSLASTAFGYKISMGKQAMLLAGYKALEYKSDQFIAKTKEIVGEKKLDEIKTAVIKDDIEKADIPDSIKAPEYEKDKDGNFLAKAYMYPCWDSEFGRPFMNSVSGIDMAMTKAATYCYSHEQISLSKIFEYLDPSGTYLKPTDRSDQYGFRDSDLITLKESYDISNPDKKWALPYHTKAIEVDGYDHAFTAVVFDVCPHDLTADESDDHIRAW